MKINSKILEVLSFFKSLEKDSKIYLVGGAVRDIILEKEPRDLDFTVEGNVTCLYKEISNNKNIINFKNLSQKFESCSFSYKNYDINLNKCRRDRYVNNKLLVEQSNINEDLYRRDFTINSIALSLDLEIIDILNGREDLYYKKIKIIHNRSFKEDSSRLIRAIRYMYKLQFSFDKETEEEFNNSLKFLNSSIRVVKELQRTLDELSPYILENKYFIKVMKHLFRG